ncbi:recombinase family protein [Streptomyces sp. NPDC052042]|uniref:recombinase family protein n=1 Tax=Streptomyces sp. NPDC052042 TaxID=3365683 RepID=UPI0037D07ABD
MRSHRRTGRGRRRLPAGRATAKTVTAWAEYEGEQKALRPKASNLQSAKNGKPHKAGLRTFGYADDYVTVVEAEAEAIRKGAEMVLQGETLAAVARYWSGLGLLAPRSSSGKAKGEADGEAKGWGVGGVKKVLISPRYIAQATYRGEVMGAGQWPAILDEATHYALVWALTNPKRFTGGARTGSAPQTLLAGLATCERCGETVRGGMYRGTPVHRCGQTHVRVPRELADKRAGNAVLARIVFPDFLPWVLASRQEQGDDSAHLHQEAQTLRERLDGLANVLRLRDHHPVADVGRCRGDPSQARRDRREAVRYHRPAPDRPCVGHRWPDPGLAEHSAPRPPGVDDAPLA